MKRVVIVGGAGEFGRRLAEQLVATSNAHVTIAGRSRARAELAALEIGAAEAAVLDRDTATANDVRALAPDLAIDAAGPFQGGNLSFARAVIEAGVHYLDLADARDFVAAFPTLDGLAQSHGVAAITGASSTPALTHAVLDKICAGWRRIDSVRAGIAPANKMQRGLAAMQAVLSWTGAPVRVFSDGAWRERGGWSDCGAMAMPGLGVRRFALAETPDLDLIPARFAPRDEALFMAGLEVSAMHRGMETLCALRGWGAVRDPVRWAKPLLHAGNLFLAFGTDRGGMVVEATGRDGDDRPVCARWTMVARDGRGPYTPTLAALVLARRFVAEGELPTGARPCVGMVRLGEFEAEFARLGFTTSKDVAPLCSPLETASGAGFETAAPAVRAGHRCGPVTRFTGEARVEGAASLLAAFIARLFGMPEAAERLPLRVTMRLQRDGETWTRQFGERRMWSCFRAVGPGRVRERFGPFAFDMKVAIARGGLTLSVVGWRIWALPLPLWLSPRCDAREWQDGEGRFCFDVDIRAPLLGRLTHYSGWLVTEEVEARADAPLSAEA